MDISVSNILPNLRTQSGQVQVKVVFSEKPDFTKDFPGEIATVAVYIEPVGSFDDICREAITKARDFLSRARAAGDDAKVTS